MEFKNLHLTNLNVKANFIPPVTAGIKLFLDAGNLSSYPGSGSNWADLSGEGYTTTINSGMTYSTEIGGSFLFDESSNAWAGVSSGFNYDYSAGLTVNVLAKYDSTMVGQWQRLIDFGNGTPQNNIILCRNSTIDTMAMDIEGYNDAGLVPGEMPIQWNQWAMYTMLADGTYWKQYLNGQFYSYAGASLLPAWTTRYFNYIGRSNWNTDAYFKGSIAVVQLYNRALSEPEILQNYQHFAQRAGL